MKNIFFGVFAVMVVVSAGSLYDVVVYGATPAGVMASVAAAREGRRTVLLEPSLYIGGVVSGGLGITDVGVHPNVSMGLCFEFFERVAKVYGVDKIEPLPFGTCDPHKSREVPWMYEPHVAEDVFRGMLDEAGVDVMLGTRVVEVKKSIYILEEEKKDLETTKKINILREERAVLSGVLTNGSEIVEGKVFVDTTYEGWLMRLAGVPYVFGREAASEYNETVGGVLPAPTHGYPYGHAHQFEVDVSPFVDDSNQSCLAHVHCERLGPVGSADLKVGAYDWRLCFSGNSSNMVPVPEPENYNASEWELLRRIIASYNASGKEIPLGFSYRLPNEKSDVKLGGPSGFTGEFVGGNWNYPNATREEQQSIIFAHREFTLGLLKFWRTDSSVPQAIQKRVAALGLPRDEFNRSQHWSPQLYIRETVRMVGQYVMRESDITTNPLKPDVIALGSYSIDVPGNVQRIPGVSPTSTVLEGGMQSPSLCNLSLPAYAIPLRSIRPQPSHAANLFNVLTPSTTHVAFNAIRMEPTWMVLGQSAGVAASMASLSQNFTVNVTQLQSRLIALGQVLYYP